MSRPVENREEHSETGDPRPEADCVFGTLQELPVRLADAISEWAARQDARHLPPGWPDADRCAPEPG